MEAILGKYLEQSFLDFLSSLVPAVPAGVLLAVIVYLVGWLVAWFISVVRSA